MTFLLYHHIGRVFLFRCVLEFRCGWLGWYPCGRLQPATRIPLQPNHTETPTHIATRTHDQCDDTIEKSQAPDGGCIKVRNMLNIEEVKENLITSDINVVSYSSIITLSGVKAEVLSVGPSGVSNYHCQVNYYIRSK